MPKRTDDSLETIVRTMPRIRPPAYLGTPVQESLPLEPGVSISKFVLGGFISATARRTLVPLTVALDFGGVVIAFVQGTNGTIQALVHTRGTMYSLVEHLTKAGEPVYQVGANACHRILTMQPADVHTAICIGSLQNVQPENGVAHIAMVGAGAKPFTAFAGTPSMSGR